MDKKNGKPVCVREQLYDKVCYFHHIIGHGGRDKTFAAVSVTLFFFFFVCCRLACILYPITLFFFPWSGNWTGREGVEWACLCLDLSIIWCSRPFVVALCVGPRSCKKGVDMEDLNAICVCACLHVR